MSAAAGELTRNIQGIDDLCTALDELVASWQEDAVIHGDIRWDNLLAVRGGDSKRWTRLQLIDWELCGAGDPAVDIGAFFGEYLRAWLQSIPITDPAGPRPPPRPRRAAVAADATGAAGRSGPPTVQHRPARRRVSRRAPASNPLRGRAFAHARRSRRRRPSMSCARASSTWCR